MSIKVEQVTTSAGEATRRDSPRTPRSSRWCFALAAAIHTDPRPLVVDPSVKALFAHPADNGFPSDHTTVAATVALLVMGYRRLLGAVLLAGSVLVGAARVAAHVHHGQDIVAGILIACVAVGITNATWGWARPRLPPRLAELARP